MGIGDIEAQPAVAHLDDSGKVGTKVGRERIHSALPPHESYEGRHRFDPQATWTRAEERKVVLKTDLHLLTWLSVMVYICLRNLPKSLLTAI